MAAGSASRHACEQAVRDWLDATPKTSPFARTNDHLPTVAVAFSGGADSTAVLVATRATWVGRTVAIHVNHGLQAAAGAFEAHCRQVCLALGVDLRVASVDAKADAGQSPEDAARLARYRALAALGQGADAHCVLLGQHADDQAETLMLALSRGAGLPGLAAMPERFERQGALFGRPMLALPGQVLRDYATAKGVPFVADPSNADQRFTRNRIRAQIMPAWESSFPGFRPLLLRSARHAAQAQRLLDELAEVDLQGTGVPPAIDALQRLGRDRQGNAVRHWLRTRCGVAPSEAQLGELIDQVMDCRTRGHRIRIKVAAGFVCREGEALAYHTDL